MHITYIVMRYLCCPSHVSGEGGRVSSRLEAKFSGVLTILAISPRWIWAARKTIQEVHYVTSPLPIGSWECMNSGFILQLLFDSIAFPTPISTRPSIFVSRVIFSHPVKEEEKLILACSTATFHNAAIRASPVKRWLYVTFQSGPLQVTPGKQSE